MPTKLESPKCKTPFCGSVPWEWNQVPVGGIPTRARCQAVASEDERQTALKLIAECRAQEQIAADNDIDGRQQNLDRPFGGGLKGIDAEMLRREISKCDHEAFLAAQEELIKLRGAALVLITPFLKRLAASFDEALIASASEAEKRIEAENLSICNGDSWTLHSDGVCQALWFRRVKTEKALAEIGPGSAIGAVQFFLTSEEHTPFNWP